MIVIAGGDLVLPNRVISRGSLVIDLSRIAAVESRVNVEPAGATIIDARGCYVVPGFVDVHVHGVDGSDAFDEGDPIARIAAALPRYGVTAFCPTTVASPPDALRRVLEGVKSARRVRAAGAARVLPAHLESNFINPAFRGAQPAACLRTPVNTAPADGPHVFSGRDILDVVEAFRDQVGIVTLAPEIEGGLDLVRILASAGHRVSLGHSGADFDTANAAIDAGARHATHLFNRMPPLLHRSPGLAGAVLSREEVAAELIFDGYHVHPAMARLAMAAKRVSRVMAISDGTAGSGLPVGSTARLGGRAIRVGEHAAVLEDGTLAGSTLTLDRAFRMMVSRFGIPIVDAVAMCSTTPARELRLPGLGVIEEGAPADLVVLDGALRVRRTFIDGQDVYASDQ